MDDPDCRVKVLQAVTAERARILEIVRNRIACAALYSHSADEMPVLWFRELFEAIDKDVQKDTAKDTDLLAGWVQVNG